MCLYIFMNRVIFSGFGFFLSFFKFFLKFYLAEAGLKFTVAEHDLNLLVLLLKC